MAPVLGLLLATPFLGALALLATPGRFMAALRGIAAATSLTALALSVVIFRGYTPGGFPSPEIYPWLTGPVAINLHLRVDGIAAPMILLTGLVIFCGVLVSWKLTHRVKDFFILLFVLVGGVYGVFLSYDLFFFFLFYEVAVLPMYLLIGVWGSTSDFGNFQRTKEYSAMKLTLVLVGASVLVWIGLIAIYWQAGLGTFDLLVIQHTAQFAPTFQRWVFPLLMVGFGVLSGLFPFHTWSPDGHVAAPTAVSMLHAGVLMKLGAFGLLRVALPLLPEGAQAWMGLLMVLGVINVVYGALSALAQKDLKYVIGYSSVSHMGYVLMGIASLSAIAVNGAVMQMFAHGVMTALFFALVGVLYDQTHTRLIAGFGGLARRAPLVTAGFVLAGLSSLGLPGLAGFVAEFLVFAGIFQRPELLIYGVLAVAGAAITAARNRVLRRPARTLDRPARRQRHRDGGNDPSGNHTGGRGPEPRSDAGADSPQRQRPDRRDGGRRLICANCCCSTRNCC
ncbi:MAG: NADH-quinone oxidoreductase subunit M [Chloroflexi bacterium]|nr:NADH-quinone oxidoreductase subunit M [Chloroflexota bacterium]